MLKYESYHFGDNNSFSFYHNINFSFIKNIHRSFEYVFVKEGQLNLILKNKTYTITKNQGALILPYEIHSFNTDDYSDSYICVFSPEYIKTFQNMIQGKCLENPVFNVSPMVQDLTFNTLFNDNDDILSIKSSLYMISSEIIKQTKLIECNKTDEILIHKVLKYIQDNFTNNISLKDIASNLGYSYNYLSKYLNETLGLSYVDFINENRISHALYLLKNTDSSITDIAYICGYSNVRSFNRNFIKIVKITPTEYRNL
ncbi:AraC family transcriptional regulator [Clostridium sp. SM-530-WT-3G]|uniref:AraC family transcriptional regulator n=1 Tax=Clostridium sp. SM-530-WT-3G TaxID=2725303 RepID=UPI00145F7873|nr:AraC family transcriptional regulator [Clostridium sp. SM-530-WT-3G]NME82156.1 AraC family transcriptional regulator [Clostridium sp. SM-530-WT-3G]